MEFTIHHRGDSSRGTAYTYQCTSCNTIHSETHPMMDDPVIKCPVCGAVSKKVILTAPSLGADHHDSMKSENIGWDTE